LVTLSQEEQEAIRAALGLNEAGAAQPADGGPEATVAEWVQEMELAPGTCPAGTTTDLYWVFESWFSRRYPGQPRFDHWAFAISLRGLGLGKKRRLSKYYTHLTDRRSADALLAARIELGPREPLDWRLGALPAAYKGMTRSPEFKDDEYRQRKRREGVRRRNRRLGRDIEARQVAAGYLVRGKRARGETP
jgi:hypothetical protein